MHGDIKLNCLTVYYLQDNTNNKIIQIGHYFEHSMFYFIINSVPVFRCYLFTGYVSTGKVNSLANSFNCPWFSYKAFSRRMLSSVPSKATLLDAIYLDGRCNPH